MKARPPDLLFALLLAGFVAVSSIGLDAVPKLHADEPWQTAPGWELVTRGRFASELFRGFHGMDAHYYGFMPLVPILLGTSARIFGLGLWQVRLVPLALASLVLALTYVLGRRLLGAWQGLAAALMLAAWPLMAPLPHLTTGIPLVDLARVARYDIAVPVFGLGALLLVARAANDARAPRFGAAGFLCGLATLSHVYGAFWLPAVLAAAPAGSVSVRRAARAVVGFALALLPWLLFVASGFRDFVDQNRNYAPRFALSNPAFYLSNLAREVDRYRLVGAAARTGALAPWLFAAAAIGGALLLLRSRSAAARALLAPAAVLAFLFALLLEQKNRMYLASLWPLLALLAAAGLGALAASRRIAVRVVAVLLVVAATAEGARRVARLADSARAATPHEVFARRLRSLVPRGARLLAPTDEWLSLQGHVASYAAIQVPLFRAQATYTPSPVPFEAAADALAPDTLLLDEPYLSFLEDARAPSHPFGALAREIGAYVERRGTLLGSADDPTYGRVRVYRISAR